MYLLEFRKPDDDQDCENSTAKPLEIILRHFDKAHIPTYAILSHRWGPAEDEVSFRDMIRVSPRHSQARQKHGYSKIEQCCRQALRDKINHAWVDTCCIDKNSSAELSEAINSMFNWYGRARVCYVHLDDVESSREEDYFAKNSSFRTSRWFTRGWTLQEMIAPIDVRFYSKDWVEIGRKREMTGLLREITKVSEDILVHPHALKNVHASQKMYWASGRETTREEDRAYSLLGLFGISLPILYGEGSYAFTRLQQEIIGSSFDHTIFAWELHGNSSGLLAQSPNEFASSARVRPMSQREYDTTFGISKLDYNVTNLGVHIRLPRRRIRSHKCLYIVFLACCYGNRITPVFLYLRRYSERASEQYFRTRKLGRSISDGVNISSYDRNLFQSQTKIWIAPPEEPLAQLLRPLIPDELAVPLESDEWQDFKAYHIRLYFQGELMTVCPVADFTRENDVTVETLEKYVTVMKIKLRPNCAVWLLLAIADGELVSHVEHEADLTLDEPSFDTTQEIRSCKAFYDRCAELREIPCTETVWRSSQTFSKDMPFGITGKAVDVIQLRQERFADTLHSRNVFAIWLRLETNLDRGGTVMKRPEPWKKSLSYLLNTCFPLFESSKGDGDDSEFTTINTSISTSTSESLPVLVNTVFPSIPALDFSAVPLDLDQRNKLTKQEERFAAGHAAIKQLRYKAGFENGLTEGRKSGKTEGHRHGRCLLRSDFGLPGEMAGENVVHGLIPNLKQVHKGVVTLFASGDHNNVRGSDPSADVQEGGELFYYDCPCFNDGFFDGYKRGYISVVEANLPSWYPQAYNYGFGLGYANSYWHAYYFSSLAAVADRRSMLEEKCRCAGVYAKGFSVGYLAGNASGRAKRFSGYQDKGGE